MSEMIEVRLRISPVYTRWQVRCEKCNTVFYVDTEPYSTGEELVELEDMRCGQHPREGTVIKLV